MKLEFSLQIFEKKSNIKFHDNPSSRSRVVPCGWTDGQTDRHDEPNSHFSLMPLRSWPYEINMLCAIGACSSVLTFESLNQLLQKILSAPCHRKPSKRLNLQFSTISNNNMVYARTCEVGATLVPLVYRS